ncbi:MAG: glycosyltransferase family 39 protein [Thermoanaerobaculia bacterium]
MHRRFAHAALLVLLLIIVVALSIGSVRLDSATSDEPAYIGAGMIKLVDGRLDYFRDEPPLMNSISAAPLVMAGYRLPPIWNLESNHWGVGKQFLWRSGFDGHRMLLLARLPTIALLVALIVLMDWFVLRKTKSPAWALAAATLTGFCPNLMAHGRLATVDLALTFFAFAATALFIVVIETGSLPAAIGMGIASAAAVMSKTSGNILGPYFLLVLIAALVFRRAPNPQRLVLMFGVAILSAIAFAEIFILAEGSAAYMRESFPHVPRVLVPFAEYAANIRAINAWYTQGHTLPQFLLGRFSTTGWPQYYPVALLLKTTIPSILLFIGALVAGVRRRSFTVFMLLLFVALFLGIAAAGHLNLGIRYVLPIYPFVYAATAIALSSISPQRFAAAVIVALIAWHAAENLIVYPSYISYFNELAGSRRNADRLLIDSNLDWGQDLRRLDAWLRDNGVKQITVHYFGGADVGYDIRAARPALLRGPGPDLLPKGWFALSRHLYRVSFAPGTWPIDYDRYLAASHARYVTTVGGSIDVYRVE